jgi:hypothetical protein
MTGATTYNIASVRGPSRSQARRTQAGVGDPNGTNAIILIGCCKLRYQSTSYTASSIRVDRQGFTVTAEYASWRRSMCAPPASVPRTPAPPPAGRTCERRARGNFASELPYQSFVAQCLCPLVEKIALGTDHQAELASRAHPVHVLTYALAAVCARMITYICGQCQPRRL